MKISQTLYKLKMVLMIDKNDQIKLRLILKYNRNYDYKQIWYKWSRN